MKGKAAGPTTTSGPSVDPKTGIVLINRLIDSARRLEARDSLTFNDINAWNEVAGDHLARAFGEGAEIIKSVQHLSAGALTGYSGDRELQVELHRRLQHKIELLNSCIKRLETSIELEGVSAVAEGIPLATDPLEALARLLDRFHRVARQLQERHGDRPTLVIQDEYDVQDLLHALMWLEFDDIRPEETTPSYAGGTARMDFLLSREQIVVEVKCTREGLADKQIGEQLLVDIQRYSKHPNCRTLVCFVYDREERIRNPRGLERDLSHADHGLSVRVLIRQR